MARIPAGLIVAILIGVAVIVWMLTQKEEEPELETSPTVQSEQPSASCEQSCATCKGIDYDARCTDRCKFNLKPYCD
jgi:uncharacterized membrane protein YraQ (UPF0718 family)